MNHPTELQLSELVDQELATSRAEEIRLHLETCSTCREYVQFLKELQIVARALGHPTPPDFADDVIRRRAAGERVLLPAEPPARVSVQHSRRRLASLVAVGLIGMAVTYVILAPPAGASRGELLVTPAAPTAGSDVEFVYSPAFYLTDNDSLRIRARARQAGDPPVGKGLIGDLRITTLRRQADGTYTGNIRLEPDDVFLAAVVEDFDAENVDTNSGRLWEIFVVDDSGRPTDAAIEARYRILEPFSVVLATEWAREVTERYPGLPIGWSLLLFHEESFWGDSLPSERVRFHRERLDTILTRLADQEASIDELVWTASYARRLGRPEDQLMLLDRLAHLDPAHTQVLNQKLLDIFGSTVDEQSRLAQLDSLWGVHEDANQVMVSAALRIAVRANNAEAALRWIDHNRQVKQLSISQIVFDLEGFAALAPQRLQLLRDQLDSLRATGDPDRPLRTGRSEFAIERRSNIAGKQWMLADALVSAGDTAEALELYRSSAAFVWDPEELEPYVELLRAVGEDRRAASLIARLVADPLTGQRTLSRFETLLPTDSLSRRQLLSSGRGEYRSGLLGSLPPPHPVFENPEVTLADGTTKRLRDLLAGRPTVLVRWNPSRPNADALLEEIRDLAKQVPQVRTVLVATRAGTPEFVEIAPIPVIEDLLVVEEQGLQVADAVRAFGIPTIVVIDSDLRVVANPQDAVAAYRIAVTTTWP